MNKFTGKKRGRQQQERRAIIRKTRTETEPKRRRTSYLQNHLITFKIDREMLYRTYSKSMTDCVICSFQFLKIVNSTEADYLRAQVERNGVTIDNILKIMNAKFKNKYFDIRMENVSFESVYQIADILPRSSATIVMFNVPKTGERGHMAILAKDAHGIPGLIDPQQRLALTGTDLERYVDKNWRTSFLIMTHS